MVFLCVFFSPHKGFDNLMSFSFIKKTKQKAFLMSKHLVTVTLNRMFHETMLNLMLNTAF